MSRSSTAGLNALIFVVAVFFASCKTTQQPVYNNSDLNTIGVRVSNQNGISTWKIPLAQTTIDDQKIGFEKMIDRYLLQLKKIKSDMKAQGVSIPFVDLENEEDFRNLTTESIKKILDINSKKAVITANNDNYEDVRSGAPWQNYVIPQAFIAYVGFKGGAAKVASIGGGVTLFLVAQPFYVIRVDNETGKLIPGATWDVELAAFGIPNAGFGLGLGAEGVVIYGGGLVFGPLEHPGQLAGFGVGPAGALSFIQGLDISVHVTLKAPPLYYVTVGAKTGASAKGSIEIDGQALLPIDKFLVMLKDLTTPE